MAKITVDKTVLEDVIKALNVMQDKGVLNFGPDGLKAMVMSLDHTAMVVIDVPKAGFKKYEVTETVKLGTDVEKLAKKVEEFETEINIDITDKVRLSGDGLTYGVALTEVKEEGHLPQITFAAKFEMPTASLKKILRRVSKVNDKFLMSASEALSIFSKGDLAHDTYEEIVEAKFTGSASSYYTLKYLTGALNATKAENATIEFSDNMPIKLTLGNVTYFIGAMQGMKW